MVEQAESSEVRVRFAGREMSLAITHEQAAAAKALARRIAREPFTRRAWHELAFSLVSGGLAAVALGVVGVTMATGVLLAVTFFGVAILALSLRSARGFGGWIRGLARSLLGEAVDDPEPFAARRGFLGWLQSALRDRVAWRAVGYLVLKVPWAVLAGLVGFAFWWDAVVCIAHPFFGGGSVPAFGLPRAVAPGGTFDGGRTFAHAVALVIAGFVFLLAAPWLVRAFVNVDRLLVRSLLGPDPVAARLHTLEQARTQTVDASAATLRRIERDLHDGTQAQLVALAMRLGMVKEKLEDPEHTDLAQVRALVDEAHRGAKEAIVELRDIARGIHPPALDIGLEGALATLAARSAVPTTVTVDLPARPTPSIEAIAYYCVAELLANVAQHAQASRASVSCAQQGTWLRLVVRDDGRGGAGLSTLGSSSSGLVGLTERVRAVDGRLYLTSPAGGPTVVTVDLPLSA
jgi:signal transduction histidine kinase